MLRISSVAEPGSLVTLRVEGTLVGPWVPLLETEAVDHLDARKLVELDFAGVSFVDRNGAQMVRRLVALGVRVLAASPLVNCLLEPDCTP